MARNNQHVLRAKDVVNDEFYTQYQDIHAEMQTYIDHNPDTFRGKTVYCNCDNPYYSQFFRYFVDHFNELGLRQLMATNYWAKPYDPLHPDRAAHKVVVRSVPDYLDTVHNEWTDTIDQLKIQDENEWTRLKGCGDFRSPECLELLEQADIVVTNPPFSLFRELVGVLNNHSVGFILIGSLYAITYTTVFPGIRDNVIRVDAARNGQLDFTTHDGTITPINVCWYSTVYKPYARPPLVLHTMEHNLSQDARVRNNPNSYQHYDNYDAIEVPNTRAIPLDYSGVMGVPVSFMNKYRPDQFRILGSSVGVDQDNNGVYGRTVILNGKQLFKRIFIEHIERNA